MGREIRRVPADWEHPSQDCPHINHEAPCYAPLFDESFDEAFTRWHNDLHLWLDNKHPSQDGETSHPEFYEPTAAAFIGYVGRCPDPESYRPDWKEEERTHYQLYENVSEGTPLSPPMPDKESLAWWYAKHGDPVYGEISLEVARRFVDAKYAPSFTYSPAMGIRPGVEL